MPAGFRKLEPGQKEQWEAMELKDLYEFRNKAVTEDLRLERKLKRSFLERIKEGIGEYLTTLNGVIEYKESHPPKSDVKVEDNGVNLVHHDVARFWVGIEALKEHKEEALGYFDQYSTQTLRLALDWERSGYERAAGDKYSSEEERARFKDWMEYHALAIEYIEEVLASR